MFSQRTNHPPTERQTQVMDNQTFSQAGVVMQATHAGFIEIGQNPASTTCSENKNVGLLLSANTSLPQCDELFRSMTHAEKVDRYSTVYVRWTAGVNAGSDLITAASPDSSGAVAGATNAIYEFFNNGLLGNNGNSSSPHLYSIAPVAAGLLPGEGSPWKLSEADTDGVVAVTTNGSNQGANLTTNEWTDFFASALQITFTGYYTAESAADALDGTVVRRSPAFVTREAGSYDLRMIQMMFRHITLRIERNVNGFVQNNAQYRMGSTGDYPGFNEFYGQGSTSAGTPFPFAFKQLPLPLLTGRAPKLVADNRFRFFLDIDSRLVVENDSTNAVPGALSVSVFNAQNPFANSMFMGVRLTLIGGMICIDKDGNPTKIVDRGEGGDMPAWFKNMSSADQAAYWADQRRGGAAASNSTAR